MATSLLQGTTIVELANPLTEYAGLLLAGLGADVYLVEPPSGAVTRTRHPLLPDASPSRQSVPFLTRNLGKKSIELDPDSPADMELLASLIDRADGLLDSDHSPFHNIAATMGADTPRATITDADGLGTSPVVAFAASGGLSSSGWPHQPPCNAPGWLALDGASIYAAIMLLVGMRRGDQPAWSWEIPLREAALAALTPWTRPLHSYGMTVAGQGVGSARMGAGPYPIFACTDGFIRILTATPKQWEAWVELLGRPEVLTTPEWRTSQYRAANYDAMVIVATEIIAERSVNEWFTEGQRLGLTITPVLDAAGFLADPHVQAREVFQEIDDPDMGHVSVFRPTYRSRNGNGPPKWQPAPALGADAAEAKTLAATTRPSRPDREPVDWLAPLRGIRVLDCGVGAVIPEAASMLALLGAEVIKVESRTHVDFLRQVGLNGPGDHNNAPTFNQMNLGVLSLAVDMRTEAGRSVVRRLVPHCDIVLENLRGPVMGKWGLDYDSVRALRPDVIYMSSQGLGDGPYGEYQTYGPNLQTFSGVTSLWAHEDDPYPAGTTLNHPDHVAGKQFLTAVLAAVLRRDRTGEGCYLDCAQFEAAAALIGDRFLQHQVLPGTVGPLGNRSLDMAPHGVYPCAGEDQWCAIAVEDDEQWLRFRATIGADWAQDPALESSTARLAAWRELDAKLSTWTQTRTPAEVEATFRAVHVPVSRLIRGDDLANDAAAHDDGIFACVPHPTAGARWQTGLPLIDAESKRFVVRRSPLLGEHDEYVLFDLLGISTAEAHELVASEAIGR